ncbi:MAG: hypothetical protein HZB43_08260 [candidate division Zixibacteria bacterium]|nr:hypothetical protein [candidate division Zixibacteria bacterium]
MNTTSKWCLLSAVLLVGLLAVAGCSGGGSGQRTADQASAELFDHNYGYLYRSDADFARLAPNYSTLRPFNVDTAIVIESKSDREGVKTPAADYEEFMYIRLNRPMNLRVIVADSTGMGLIVYDFENMASGQYSLGSKGWPVPQIEATKKVNWVYVYVVGDQRLRDRRQFKLDARRHFLPLPPAPAVPS